MNNPILNAASYTRCKSPMANLTLSAESRAIWENSISVIFSGPTLLLFLSSSVNPNFSLSHRQLGSCNIRSIWPWIKVQGYHPAAPVLVCRKNSVSPPSERTFVFVSSKISPITGIILQGIPYDTGVFSILPRCTLSKAFLKSVKVRNSKQIYHDLDVLSHDQ